MEPVIKKELPGAPQMVGLLNRLESSCLNLTVIWWSSELQRRTGLESNHSPCPLVAGNRTAFTPRTTVWALLPTLSLSCIIPSFMTLLDSTTVKMIAWHPQFTLPQEELYLHVHIQIYVQRYITYHTTSGNSFPFPCFCICQIRTMN